MNKKIWIVLSLPIILGCQTLLTPSSREAAPQTPPGLDSTQSAQTSTQTEFIDYGTFTLSRIHVGNGDLLAQLATESDKANAMGLSPFIEFDATWCPPCQAINASIASKDPLTLKAFDGIYLIRADVDEWGWGNKTNFDFEAIPIYYKLNKDGLPSGDKVDGGAWNEDIPENFAPVLDNFFHQH
jgi:thiol-disulfide isomerase/thioredoxin